MTATAQTALEALVARQASARDVTEVVLCAHIGASGTTLCAATGQWRGRPVDAQTPFFTASAAKLFATAMIMRLRQSGRIGLDDRVQRFFPGGEIDGLHRIGDTDHTPAITLRHLLSHTSGLPDYFEGRRRNGTRFAEALLAGHDSGPYGLAEVLAWTREEMRPHFVPGAGRRAHYSDTNFYLLGEVISRACGKPLPDALSDLVTGPLGLRHTTFAAAATEALPMRNGGALLHIPQAMASMPVDGGVVSTASDMLVFTRAFFDGSLFPATYLDEMADWRRIFFPMRAGVGMLQFRLPRLLSPLRRMPELRGHSGISGAFAFHCPERRITLAGTVNQIADRSRPYRFMLKALDALRDCSLPLPKRGLSGSMQ